LMHQEGRARIPLRPPSPIYSDPCVQIKGTVAFTQADLGLWYTKASCFQPIGVWQSTHT
jgi:hypothetical protein